MSTTWVVLVRGINLGPHKRLAMPDFRRLLEDLGYGDVRTHLHTGNAVFTANDRKAATIEREVADRLLSDLALDVKVMARTGRDIKAVVDANPFAHPDVEPKQLQAAFLSKDPPADKRGALDPDAYAPDRFAFGRKVVYLHMPNGFQGTRLPNWEKSLGVDATVRTWNVVLKLADLASAAGS